MAAMPKRYEATKIFMKIKIIIMSILAILATIGFLCAPNTWGPLPGALFMGVLIFFLVVPEEKQPF